MEIEWIVKLQKLDNDKFVRGRGLHKTTLFRLFSQVKQEPHFSQLPPNLTISDLLNFTSRYFA